MDYKKIVLPKTYRYVTYGDVKTAQKVWIVLHGYGHLPNFFVRHFHCLCPKNNYVIVPEGIHRFYLNGTSGRVGASWMTKESRSDDISDNLNFLNAIYQKEVESYHFSERILLGFSQGGATASRWHENGNYHAHKFILWASVFPPDLDFSSQKTPFQKSKNYFVIGDSDEYFNESTIKELKNHFNEKNLQFKWIHFNGKHQLDPTILATF